MNRTISFKPIVWRLAIWTFGIYYLFTIMFGFIYEKIINHYPGYSFLSPALALGFVTGSIIARNGLVIEISEDKISGPSGEIFRKRNSFQLKDLDKTSLGKQTLYEKISGFHSICSVSGEKIIFTNFIYGESKLDEFYRIVTKE